MTAVQFAILGPVEVTAGGRPLSVGGPRARAVLARLIVAAGRVVGAEALAGELWPDLEVGRSAANLQVRIAELRRAFRPAGLADRLVTRGGGYLLVAGPGEVDAARFDQLAARGRALMAAGDAAGAAGCLEEALGLWRGPPLADAGDWDWARAEAARLEEARLAAVECHLQARLDCGQASELIAELQTLTAEHPLRENLWRLLVLALYRAQRQAEALAAYRRARELLATELGLEPGEELRALEQAVLRQQVPSAPPSARHNLPAPLTSFLGRERELAELAALLAEARLVTLCGTGGVGKTRLALEHAAGAVGRFADGVWLAELTGVSDAGLVPVAVMEALGVRQEHGIPAVEALVYRLRLADLLLVLDNCEHLLDACAQLTGTLLRGSPGLRVLTTSREALGLPGEAVYPVRPLALPPPRAGEQAIAQAAAVRLLLDRGSAARGGAGLGAPMAVAGRICAQLDGLPLAIELAAARLGTLSAADIEAQLADRFTFLAARRPADDPRHQTLRAAVDWSYDLLTAAEREMFEQLSVFAGSCGLAQVAQVCTSGDRAAALEMIDGLAGKSLVTAELAEDGTRYRLLETVRQYAAARLAKAGDPQAARRRHALAYLRLAGREHDPAVLAPDLDNFRAALDWSLSQGDETGPRLALALGDFWLARGLLQEGRGWLERALARPVADQRLRAGLLRVLGTLLYDAGDLNQASAVLAEGAEVAAAAGAPALRARIRVVLAESSDMRGGTLAEALEECQAATAVLESEGDLAGLAEGWLMTGRFQGWLGDPAATDSFERAIDYARHSGNHRARIQAGYGLIASFQLLPIPADAAIARAEQLLHDLRGEQQAEAHLLLPLSLVYAYAGRFAEARAALARCRSLLTAAGARLALAGSTYPAGHIELAAGDPAAAERCWRDGYEAYRAMGERGTRSTLASYLAEALYLQGRLDEAQRMTETAETLTQPDDIETQAQWRATQAKLLARHRQFPAARQLITEAEALILPTCHARLKAHLLVAKAEVNQLAGDRDQAQASLHTALRIYEDHHVLPLAGQVKAALTSLATHPASEPP
jgi:predicted ATPase/DNA-binding SARP family transcriptional activator